MLIEKSAIAKWRMAQNLAAIAKRVIPASDEVMELNDLGRMARLPLLGKIKTQLTGAATSTAQDLATKAKNLPGMDWQTKKWTPYTTTTLPVEQSFDALGNPQQLFRVHHATQAANPYISGYSKNFSHATPVPKLVEQYLDRGIHTSLVPRAFESKADFPAVLSVLDAAKRQRYYPDFGVETAKGNFFPIQFKSVKELLRQLVFGRDRKLGKTYQQAVAAHLKNPQQAAGFKPATPSGLISLHARLHETAVRPGRNPVQQVYAVLQNNAMGTGSKFTPLSEQQRRTVQSLARQAATKINLPQTPTRFINQKIQSVTEPFAQQYPETIARIVDAARRATRLFNGPVNLPEKTAGSVYANQHTIQALAKQAALRTDVQLQPHQERVRDRLSAEDKRLLLYHGLGTGKSLSSLAAAEGAGGDYAAVVPAALKPNYEKEITKFTDSTPEVLTYTGVGAGKQPKRSPETLIFDEAHRLRNPNTASARAATELAQKAKNVLLLTGTPITNAPSDLASLASILNQKSITPEAFNERYVGHKKVYPSWLSRLTGRNVGEEGVLKNEEELRQLFRGKVDYQPGKSPEGVDVNEETVRVPLGRSQERLQTAVRDKIPPEYAWKFDKQFPLSRDELQGMNSFLTGLRQSSLSTLPFRGDKDPLKSFDESSKLQRAFQDLKTELKTDPRKKGLVYSNYIDAGLSPYAAALKREGIPYGMYHGSMSAEERKQALKGYNEGNLRALLLGPAAAEGISTQGTNLIQVLDPHWHESRSRQAEGRGLRFDSHAGLPEELRHVAIKRYLSESRDPSLIMSLLGKRRHRTGDEILERLSADKEKLNNQFRKILQEEGRAPKDEIRQLAKAAAMALPA